MLLESAAVFALLGIVMFGFGLAYDRPELAMFGAIIVIGIGGVGVVQGYQIEDGSEVVTVEEVQPDLTLSNSELVQSKAVQQNAPEPRGLDWSDAGSDMYTVSADDITAVQYTSGPFDLSTATYNRTHDISGNVSAPTGIEVEDDDTRMYVTDNGTEDRLVQYDLAEPRNVSTAQHVGNFDVSPWASQPRLTDFSDDGTKFFMTDANNGTISSFGMSDPWNVSSASHLRSYDVSAQEDVPQGMAFENEGEQLLVVGTEVDTVFVFELSTGYDLSTASYTGDSYSISSESNFPSAVAYEQDGQFFYIADSQSDELFHYRSTVIATSESTDKTYADVNSISSFPLELIVVLLGAVMMMTATGRASEQ